MDLSNVFGVSFQGLFSSLPPADGEVSLPLATSDPSKSVGLAGFIPAALIASIVAVPVIFANPAILLTALVSALSIIISLFFLFILLSVREAAIIVLIVASPLAVICYMLPNMKKMFERWWKLFSGLLLVYPVSSLLVGAGNYISKLLLKTSADGGFLNLFTAMIIGVAPIFFIPTVLKGSFSAMGKVGGTLAGLGKTVSGGASKRMRDSEGYKNLQESGKMWNTKLKAGIGPISGKPRELGRLGTLMRGGKRGVARARAQYRSDQATLGAQNDLLNNGIFGSRLEADKKAQALKGYQEQFANMGYDKLKEQVDSAGSWLGNDDGEQRMSALIQAMESNGMESDIYDMLRTNNVSNMTGVMSTLAGSNNKILKAYGKKGRGVDYNTFVGGTGANTLSEYAKSKGADFVNGLDDKALAEIKANGSHVMSTAQLVQAASQLTEQSAINEVNDMLGHRNDVALSGEQLANLNSSTVGRLLNTGSRTALITASDDLATNIDLRNKLDPEARRLINRARVTSGRQAI